MIHLIQMIKPQLVCISSAAFCNCISNTCAHYHIYIELHLHTYTQIHIHVHIHHHVQVHIQLHVQVHSIDMKENNIYDYT